MANIVAVVAGLASAACWFISAIINVQQAAVGGAYWSAPVTASPWPRQRLATFLNGAAALLSGVAVLAQVM
jgi:hypothetical protein